MPNPKKPTPKSQRQISNEQVNPYINPENGETLGNPNIPSDYTQFTKNNQNGTDFNRSEKLSFTDDTTKPFSISIQDIDESIFYYFENIIKPSVYQNEVRIPVPLIYGSLPICSFACSMWLLYKCTSPKLPINSSGTILTSLAMISSSKP